MCESLHGSPCTYACCILVPLETWLETVDDKKAWVATASYTKGVDFLPSFAIDGTHANTDAELFMSNAENAFPWLQAR